MSPPLPHLRRALLAGALLAAGLGASPTAAETRSARGVGAAPASGAPAAPGVRDAAQRAALREAVVQVALGLLPPDADPAAARPAVEAAIGGDALDFTNRFRVVVDRGVQPRSVLTDPAVSREYVVEVEAAVDAEKLRARLGKAGLVRAPPPAEAAPRSGPIDLALEGIPSARTYAEVRRALVERLGARSAIPRELAPGRAVLRVEGGPAPEALLAELAQVLPAGVGLEPLPAEGEGLRARLLLVAPPPGEPADPGSAAAAPATAPPAIDTVEPKGY